MTPSNNSQASPDEKDQAEPLRLRLEQDIRRLQSFSHRGLLALSLFLLICMLAWRDFPLLPARERVISLLGAPPTSQMISIMLLLYTFSAIVLSLSRMMGSIEHKSSFCHVGYLTSFFLFYHFAHGLDENFWAVLGSGVTILGVESYRIWSFAKEGIARKVEQLDHLRRTGRLPLED